jgi:hypothetical protein
MLRNFIETLKYLISPKLSSLSSNSDKKKVPKVKLDSLLRSWGLLSGEYRTDGTIETTRKAKLHQIFAIIFLIYYCLSLTAAMILSDDSIYIYYIGDVSALYMQNSPRIYTQMLFFLATVKSLCMALCYYYNQKSGQLCWLGIPESIRGKAIIILSKNLFFKYSLKRKSKIFHFVDSIYGIL